MKHNICILKALFFNLFDSIYKKIDNIIRLFCVLKQFSSYFRYNYRI